MKIALAGSCLQNKSIADAIGLIDHEFIDTKYLVVKRLSLFNGNGSPADVFAILQDTVTTQISLELAAGNNFIVSYSIYDHLANARELPTDLYQLLEDLVIKLSVNYDYIFLLQGAADWMLRGGITAKSGYEKYQQAYNDHLTEVFEKFGLSYIKLDNSNFDNCLSQIFQVITH